MKTLFTAALATTILAASPTLAAQYYNYSIGNNTFVLFEGADGDFAIDTATEVRACQGDNYDTFFGALTRNGQAEVLLQTYPCGKYLKVCVDPKMGSTFDPESCGTFVWFPSED